MEDIVVVSEADMRKLLLKKHSFFFNSDRHLDIFSLPFAPKTNLFPLEGRDRLDMVVELKVQYCRENLKDLFLPLRHFYGVHFL